MERFDAGDLDGYFELYDPPTRRHTGDYLGVAPAGRDVSADGITILRFENGKCVERWSVFDFFSLLLQLGAIEPPPAHA